MGMEFMTCIAQGDIGRCKPPKRGLSRRRRPPDLVSLASFTARPYLEARAEVMSAAEAQKMEPPKTCRAFENISPRILKPKFTQDKQEKRGRRRSTGRVNKIPVRAV